MCYNKNMIKKIEIKPDEEMLKHWVNTLIPPYDVFFFQELSNIDVIDKNLITTKKYIQTFSDITYINAYEHWNVKNNSKFVYIDYKNNLLSNENIRDYIYKQQIKCCRGLILQDKTIISNWLFNTLTYNNKKNLTIKYAKEIDDWYGYINEKIPSHIKKIANKFVKFDGCNCLSTTIYAVSKNNDILLQWMTENEFLIKLKELNYQKVEGTYRNNDVVVFKNKSKF